MYRCFRCNHEFARPKQSREPMGEYQGQTAYEDIDICPYCGNDDFEESKYEDVYGTYVYKDDVYYELGYDIVHEDNLDEYLADNKHFG